MLFDNDFDYLFNVSMNNNYSNNTKLYSSKEGFLRGNMFKDEYKPYKNMTYLNIQSKNEKEAKLFKVMEYSFAVNDLNLYLDLHPEDSEMFNLFKKYVVEEKKAHDEYVKSFGPLEVCDNTGSKYEWLPCFPWEDDGGIKYV